PPPAAPPLPPAGRPEPGVWIVPTGRPPRTRSTCLPVAASELASMAFGVAASAEPDDRARPKHTAPAANTNLTIFVLLSQLCGVRLIAARSALVNCTRCAKLPQPWKAWCK